MGRVIGTCFVLDVWFVGYLCNVFDFICVILVFFYDGKI